MIKSENIRAAVLERAHGVSTQRVHVQACCNFIPTRSAHTGLLSDRGDMGAHRRQELLGKALGLVSRMEPKVILYTGIGVSLYHGNKQSPRNQMFSDVLKNSAADTILKARGPF